MTRTSVQRMRAAEHLTWLAYLDDQPCPICKGIEGRDHAVKERRDALLEQKKS